ncbi:adenylate/guanylate cyclase domain-containing protein [Leisingera aquimarina]|uniref:adenylate/guanylate cyclase domain-containing protein n=1 Tax=Leisingera aquimarina TaxID=476529 RepID=UPI0003F7034E|nr:adenylate/guanylate cyclase domain-containing protein [Leisingera aquimarina]
MAHSWQRRLTTVLASDIVDFSRLVGSNEEAALGMLHRQREEVINPLLTKFGGRLVNTAGDSMLIEFTSAVEAVRFATGFQTKIGEFNNELPAAERMLHRIGINAGDVVEDGDDLLGDGVNVAARLEALAPPGGIIISRSVRDQVRDRLSFRLQDLGEINVKNIARAVRVFQLLREGEAALKVPPPNRRNSFLLIASFLIAATTAIAAWLWVSRTDFEPVLLTEMSQALPDGPSFAVMPFDYIGEDADQNIYLADGVSENVIANLANLPETLVIAKSSTFAFKGKDFDVRDVAAEFGVRYVLDGSVQLVEDRIRVTAQLIDAVAGRHLWSETFDRKIDDFFKVQDEITLAVVQQVYDKTVSGERLDAHETDNLEAFAEMAKGEALRVKFTQSDNYLARQHFARAADLDPSYAAAQSRIGFTHLMDARMGFSTDPARSISLAEAHMERALELDPDRPGSLESFALVRVIQKRPDEARDLALRAVRLGPGDASAIRGTAWVLKYIGDSEESLEFFARAVRITPVTLWWLIADQHGAMMDAGEFEAAFALTDELLAATPEAYRAHFFALAAIPAWQIGEKARAIELMDEARKINPQLSISDYKAFDLAYVDNSLPEKRYLILKELGLSDRPE